MIAQILHCGAGALVGNDRAGIVERLFGARADQTVRLQVIVDLKGDHGAAGGITEVAVDLHGVAKLVEALLQRVDALAARAHPKAVGARLALDFRLLALGELLVGGPHLCGIGIDLAEWVGFQGRG